MRRRTAGSARVKAEAKAGREAVRAAKERAAANLAAATEVERKKKERERKTEEKKAEEEECEAAAAAATAAEAARREMTRTTRAKKEERAKQEAREAYLAASNAAGFCACCGIPRAGMQGGNFKRHISSCKGPGVTVAERKAIIAWRDDDRDKTKKSRWENLCLALDQGWRRRLHVVDGCARRRCHWKQRRVRDPVVNERKEEEEKEKKRGENIYLYLLVLLPPIPPPLPFDANAWRSTPLSRMMRRSSRIR